MSSKRLDAISDYRRHGYMLRVDCKGCGREVLIEPWQIVDLCQRHGWSRQMNHVEKRLVCSKCGGRSVQCGPSLGRAEA